MPDIYDQHAAAFARVSAYVILRNGERVATIAFKFPADGAGRLYAYVHWFGVPMVRGFASGYGYDKRSAAVASAANKIDLSQMRDPDWQNGFVDGGRFRNAVKVDDGSSWDTNLTRAGFTVLQAV